jgi:hypothetical protein
MCVAGGFALAMTTLPVPRTPDRVAQDFVEARFDGDWRAAWEMLCRPVRESVAYATFVERFEYVNDYYVMPSDVDVTAGDVRVAPGPNGPALTVDVRVTSDERNRENWAIDAELLVVEEDGGLRVCSDPERAET